MPKKPENIPNFKPMHDRLLVRRIEEPEGDIALPGDREKPQQGIVLCKGDGVRDTAGQLIPMTCVVGDHIYFGKYAGTELKIEDEMLVNMREEEVLGVIPDLAVA